MTDTAQGQANAADADVEDQRTPKPEMLREAVQLLAFRSLPTMGGADREAVLRSHRLTLEATRDQSQQYAAPGGGPESGLSGAFTGDPSIDMLLVQFVRGPIFGAA